MTAHDCPQPWMRVRGRRRRRPRGATAVEFAICSPVLFFLLLALYFGGIAVFRYQMVGYLACEGSRYAAVHGADYAQASGQPAADGEQVRRHILERSAMLDPKRLECDVRWRYPDRAPSRADPDSDIPGQRVQVNTVSVTVRYRCFDWGGWLPPLTVVSSSEAPVAF